MESQPVERRLAAILSADAVGYSRLMAQDEGGTIATVTAHRAAIAACVERERGRVVDSPGDNLLAEFPTALEALRCALEIQRELGARNAELVPAHRMPFRIGVHLGDVAVQGDRLYGDGVNVAARIEALAEPGGILVSALVVPQVRGKLDVELVDQGEKALKNIPDPVRVYSARPPSSTFGGAGGGARTRPGRRIALAVGIAVLFALVGWLAWPLVTDLAIDAAGLRAPDNPPLPERPSIVVLPFENISNDAEQEYFSDGLTEDLTTQLSLNPYLFVIARNSAFTYKGRAVNVEQIGRELGVRYVLEGSVRRAGDRIRVTAQLIDATTNFHVWSGRYDRELADIFALQDEINGHILAGVGVEIIEAEQSRARRKPTQDLSAYDAFQRGYWHFSRFRLTDMAEARRWLERAVELDPEYARAIAQLGSTYTATLAMGWPSEPGDLDRALELADRAEALDPTLPGPSLIRAAVLFNRRKSEEAEAAARSAVALAPGEPVSYVFLGVALAQQGRFAEALESLKTTIRLNPRSGDLAPMQALLANVWRRLGRTDEAVAAWERARVANPDLVSFRIPLADYYEQAGRHAEAAEVVREILAANPQMTAEAAANGAFLALGTSEVPGVIAHLRSAGLP